MERLDSLRLREEQRVTLATPRRKASLSARALFVVMDRVYGEARTLEKFRVLELVARVPYQAWENVAYVAVTHTASQPGFARRIFESSFSDEFGQYESLADLFRQIGYDERLHKLQSEAAMAAPRFT